MLYQTYPAKKKYRSYLTECLNVYTHIIENLPTSLTAEQYDEADVQFSEFGEKIILAINALERILVEYESLHGELNAAAICAENTRKTYNDYCASHANLEIEAARQVLYIKKRNLNDKKITLETKRYQLKKLDDDFTLFLKSKPTPSEQIETEKRLFSDYYMADYYYQSLNKKQYAMIDQYQQLDRVIANEISSLHTNMHFCFYHKKIVKFALHDMKINTKSST